MDRPEGTSVGMLVGEEYRPVADPQEATPVQRSWQYQQDAALRNIQYGGKKPPPSLVDNEMSLPLGEGGHRAQHAKLMSRGSMARVTTSITTGKESKYGISIFRD